jgi:hypothetical protein
MAVARLAKAEPAAVALDNSQKWHAFETVTGINPESVSAFDPESSQAEAVVPFQQVDFLPSLSRIGETRQQIDDLKAKVTRLDALMKGEPDPKNRDAIKEEKSRTEELLTRAHQSRAASVFGVDESEISRNIYPSDRIAGKINLTANTQGGNTGGRHGPVVGQKDTDFHIGLITAFDVNAEYLDTPEKAQGTLFHEVSHLMDAKLAQTWAKQYEQETGRLFVGGPGLKIFLAWINEQVQKKRLSAADAQVVVDEAANVTASTEARANIRTFLTYFRARLFDLATEALVNYAKALPPGKEYGQPPNKSAILIELTSELKSAFREAGKAEKELFKKAMDAAKTANRTAWFATIDVAK